MRAKKKRELAAKGVRERFDFFRKKTERIQKDIGYEEHVSIYCPTFSPPEVSVVEKLDAICEHLGIVITRTSPEVVVTKEKKKE